MTPLRFITASLRHYRRVHLAVALGVAVATAVLTGALLVGDSVTGSLRDLTLQRLGYIDSALITGHTFRATLADELVAKDEFQKFFWTAEPAILLSGTLQSGSGDKTRRATSISIIGCRNSFGELRYGTAPTILTTVAAVPPSVPYLNGDEVVLTEPLARELGVAMGDQVLLRVPLVRAIPSDSPLGEKTDTSIARRLTVVAVLPPRGQARFSLMPSQHAPRNVFVPLAMLQDLIKKPGRANAILVAKNEPRRASSEAAQRALGLALKPKLEDYGIHATEIAAPSSYVQIASEELVLPDAVVDAAQKTFGAESLQPVSTYLANTITAGSGDAQRKIPYSTISGVDSVAGIGPLLDENGKPIVLADDEIALNRWAADDLQVQVGDTIAVTLYEPESTYGELRERTPPPTFKLRAIVDLEEPDGTPTAAADPNLTPELAGVTDKQSVRDWELPFQLVETVRDEDEEYWDKYGTTPKAFVSLATAERLWPSRWGTISLLRLRIPPTDGEAASAAGDAAHQLAAAIPPESLGMTFLPVKAQGLAASSGTTPFGGLFLGFSVFLIAAALMLIALLFQLGIQQRARELGTLAAVGVGRKRIASLLSREGLVVAIIGATVGVAGGVLYAWLMILGLRTWWLAAIATPFIELHVGWPSLVIGWLAGVLLSWVTIRWSIRRMTKATVGQLLSGSSERAIDAKKKRGAGWRWAVARIGLIVLIAVLIVFGFRLQGEAQAGVFFGSGAAALVLMLGEIRHWLRNAGTDSTASRSLSVAKLALLNATRNPGRSTLTIGLVAAASFLIVAISAFRLETSDAGTGGFDNLATSDRPIHYDLNTPEGRLELGFSDDADQVMQVARVYSLRVASGEDASCLNLYRPTQPRILGVPRGFIERGGFAWAGIMDGFEDQPWNALLTDLGNDDRNEPVVPVVIDASTAVYSLHLKGVGSRLPIRDAADKPVTLQVVGLLKNSVLQGSVLMSEANFLRLFPDTGGYRFFLIEQSNPSGTTSVPTPANVSDNNTDTANPEDIAAILESTLANEGFDVVDAREQLAAFLAVQNTYLSTFQSLGALGLLLGTVGLAIVQLRSVLERRGELALMRAGGFPRSRLVQIVILENAVLLLGGLAVGCIAAAIALVPQWGPQGASFPWLALGVLLATIALVGLGSGWLATRSALRAPILPALRGD